MSTLGAVLQGMDRGVSNGLALYKTVQDEARQKRLDAREVERDRRRDMEADRTWENNLSRQAVEDEQWGKTHAEDVRKTDATIEHNKGMLGVSQQNARTSAGHLGLAQQKQNYIMDEDRRARALETHRSRVTAASYGPDGNLLTGQALRDNLNRTGAIADLAQIKALETGVDLGNYTGLQAVPGPDGRVAIQVAGKDRTGKPIEGQAFMSERGTSDPDDPYVAFDLDTEVARINPALREAQRSNALARDQKAAVEAQFAQQEQAVLGDFGREIEGVTAQIRADEARLVELQAERAKLPETITRPDPRGEGMNTRGNPRAMELDAEIATLSAGLRDKENTVSTFMRDAQSVPETLAPRRAASLGAIDSAARVQGETYAANQRASALAAPARQATAAKDAEKGFREVEKAVISDNVFKPRKGEEPPKVSSGQFRVMLGNLPPEVRMRVGAEPRYQAALHHVAEHVARTGITGDLTMLLEASAAGADLEAYSTVMSAPQKPGDTLAGRHAAAMEVAVAKAADPSRDTESLAGALYLPR